VFPISLLLAFPSRLGIRKKVPRTLLPILISKHRQITTEKRFEERHVRYVRLVRHVRYVRLVRQVRDVRLVRQIR
jgi:hypothetical protein